MKLSHLIVLTLLCICNQSESVLNGDKVKAKDLDEFKYLVSILARAKGTTESFVCGGAILNDYLILTAAHCFAKRAQGQIPDHESIVVIAHTLSNRVMINQGSMVRGVAKVYVPAGYFQTKYDHDIGIIQLKKSLNLLRNFHKLKAVKLPEENFATVGKEAVLAGYGAYAFNENGERVSDGHLRSMDVTVVPDSLLDDLLVSAEPTVIVSPKGFCAGDSGSPLVIRTGTYFGLSTDYIIIGTVKSNKPNCDDTKQPGVYTRVSSYLNNFINKIMNNPDIDDSSIIVKEFSEVSCCP